MTKKPTKSTKAGALVPVAVPATLAIPGTGATIQPLQVYRNDRHPKGPGPWEAEPDKVAWRDASTGLDCTILRSVNGTLAGYVGVRSDHPLFGFDCRAVPANMIDVHGGLTHGAACEVHVPEPVSVCHAERAAVRVPRRPARPRPQPGNEHDDLWWLGFSTNHSFDFVPGDERYLGPENGRPYRDLGYVYGQVVRLATQLHALAHPGDQTLPVDPSTMPPPRGLEQ